MRPMLLALALLAGSVTAQGTSPGRSSPLALPKSCALADAVGPERYLGLVDIEGTTYSMVETTGHWTECRVTKLARDLRGSPQLLRRLQTLRAQLRALRQIEFELGFQTSGGGSLWRLVGASSWAGIETGLAELGALASSSAGAQGLPGGSEQLRASRQTLAEFRRRLRAARPADARLTPAQWSAALDRHQSVEAAAARLLGTRPDAATVLGYGLLAEFITLNEPR